MSKEKRTVEEVLEDLYYDASQKCFTRSQLVPDALSTIQEIIEGCKPEKRSEEFYNTDDYSGHYMAMGFNQAIDQFHEKLQKVMK